MDGAFAAVLLRQFSELRLYHQPGIAIHFGRREEKKDADFWIRLTPCLIRTTPLRDLQAAAGIEKPLNQMVEYERMEAFCKVCGELDVIVKNLRLQL
jgi:hypothetical protein